MSEALLSECSTFLESCNVESVYEAFSYDAVDCRCCLEYQMHGTSGADFSLSSKRVTHRMGAGMRKRRFFFTCNCSVIDFSSSKFEILDSCICFIGFRKSHRSCLVFITLDSDDASCVQMRS